MRAGVSRLACGHPFVLSSLRANSYTLVYNRISYVIRYYGILMLWYCRITISRYVAAAVPGSHDP